MTDTPASLDETASLYLRARDVPCPECGYNRRDGTNACCPECKHVLTLSPTAPADRALAVAAPRWHFGTVLAIAVVFVITYGLSAIMNAMQGGMGAWPFAVRLQMFAPPVLYLGVAFIAMLGLRACKRRGQTHVNAERVKRLLLASSLSLLGVLFGLFAFSIAYYLI